LRGKSVNATANESIEYHIPGSFGSPATANIAGLAPSCIDGPYKHGCDHVNLFKIV